MKETTEPAYAKINLSLDVTARRTDGYHEIDGVMQSVSLCDHLTVCLIPSTQSTVELTAAGNPDMPTDERNLAVRAAYRYLEATGLGGKVHLDLRKNIPMAGGLAGGSADAAAVLRALNRLYGFPLTTGQLCRLGFSLGADVPFCITGGCMRTQGVGEILTFCSPLPDCTVVIARRGAGVSTPWAYGRLDDLYRSFAPDAARPDARLASLLGALEKQSLSGVCDSVYNIFEPVVSEVRHDVEILRDELLKHGAMTARMSGSGPSVFGIFAQEKQAGLACASLQREGAEAFVCHPVTEISGR